MLPALWYWTIVVEPRAPVESGPLPYSIKVKPSPIATESGWLDPSMGAWNVLISPICGEGAAFLSGMKVTPCGEPKVKPGPSLAEPSAVNLPVMSSVLPNAPKVADCAEYVAVSRSTVVGRRVFTGFGLGPFKIVKFVG